MRTQVWLMTAGLAASLAGSVSSVDAEPIRVPFSVKITVASDDFFWLFGQPMHPGDQLSGRVVLEGEPSGDGNPDNPNSGTYGFEGGRFEFDTASNPTLDAGPIEPLWSFVLNDNFFVNTGLIDQLVFELNGADGSFFVSVGWTDFTAQALDNDGFPQPIDLSRFQFSRFQLQTFRDGTAEHVIRGTSSDVAPVPEPSTLILTLLGGTVLARRFVRSRKHIH